MIYLCLTIQSDPATARSTNAGLESYGLKPYQVSTIKAAVAVMRQWRFDVVLLDADGFGDKVPQMLTELRSCRVPILVSSSALEEHAQIRQLELGATALVTKPASLRLTALRLRKLAEIRFEAPPDVSPVIRLGPLLIDTRRVQVSVGGVAIELSSRPFEILLLLATRAGEFVHRQDIASTVRQVYSESSRSIDMHICKIRRRLAEAGENGLAIHTIYGRGYCLTYEDQSSVVDEEVPKWCA